MLAPTDKKNDTIQILITRRCDLRTCSNCTQLLPYRQDAIDMSPDVFRLALRSLAGWPGIRGIFGGNPCAHPRFAELMDILVAEVPDQRQRGIWTNNLLGHGAIVRRVFYPHGRFNLNAHADERAAAEIDNWLPGRLIESSRGRPSWHSPILMDYRDIGMTDDEWIVSRETCDINQRWSAAIMERDGKPFAYFCEVAGAIDGVRGENHGVEAAPGWWRWKMDRFGHQVRGCCDRGCGVPLRGLGHLDRDDTYDVTQSWVPLTVDRKPNVAAVVHETMPQQTEQPTDYQTRWTKKPCAA